MERRFEVTTTIGCPLMCSFCPQDKIRKAYKSPIRVMTQEVFETALNKIPLDIPIGFAGYAEPWLNKNCNNFVRYALGQGRKVGIYTTLYGMSYQQGVELIEMLNAHQDQMLEFYIHLPDSHGNMVGWRSSPEYQELLDLFAERFPTAVCMTMDSDGKFDPRVKVSQPVVQWYLHTRADNVDVSKVIGTTFNEPPRYEFVVECTRDPEYKSNMLLPNGDLALCTMDYGLKHILGNILTQSYEEIRNGPVLTRLIEINNSFGFTRESLCRSCNDGHCKTPFNDEEVYQRFKQLNPNFKL